MTDFDAGYADAVAGRVAVHGGGFDYRRGYVAGARARSGASDGARLGAVILVGFAVLLAAACASVIA